MFALRHRIESAINMRAEDRGATWTCSCVGIEVKEEYAELARARLRGLQLGLLG